MATIRNVRIENLAKDGKGYALARDISVFNADTGVKLPNLYHLEIDISRPQTMVKLEMALGFEYTGPALIVDVTTRKVLEIVKQTIESKRTEAEELGLPDHIEPYTEAIEIVDGWIAQCRKDEEE